MTTHSKPKGKSPLGSFVRQAKANAKHAMTSGYAPDPETRLACLKLAAETAPSHEVVKRAEEYYQFVRTGSVSPRPAPPSLVGSDEVDGERG